MALIRFYHPGYPEYRDENANEAYEKLVRHFNNGACGCNQLPASNITESEKEYVIEMALPGVDKNNISIRHENDHLFVKVEKSAEKQHDEKYSRFEFDYSDVSRSFKLGGKVETGNISAKYENGILRITLPKKEAYVNKPAQAIVVE